MTCSKILVEFNAGANMVFIDPAKGPIFYEQSRRENNLSVTRKILEHNKTIKEKSVVIIGWWMPLILVEQEKDRLLQNSDIEYIYYPDETLIKDWQTKNIKVYYISDLKRFIKKMGKIDIEINANMPLLRACFYVSRVKITFLTLKYYGYNFLINVINSLISVYRHTFAHCSTLIRLKKC
ncbi:MAG: hypothetical protein A2452_10140 [Candidatus Firestonebacteria bacterium RIFOXYC2_FULL_39_67]|nr:MAG: hypothetical protein A2536_06510 [Candidatus Firestonebacteria bacterium RIFOXYD2_FULL_39_29]OGF54263.1 MAG: hypothetical protein A2452_10140 [Candidatus Firestonebacteria bacterium RIFOXYC2_FULL_39_67]OGF56891.1 MAG: hypothetical protein A2497_06080 [Candidatus Firestonebacteria bacterium RifOxyC12_full_39_7]